MVLVTASLALDGLENLIEPLVDAFHVPSKPCCLCYPRNMRLTVEYEREEDGRWLAAVPDLPGVMAYGPTRDAALAAVEALALRVIADRLEQGEAAL